MFPLQLLKESYAIGNIRLVAWEGVNDGDSKIQYLSNI